MKKNTVLYHGTIVPGILKFKIGVQETGETDEPINGIWLGTEFKGAHYQAVRVTGRVRQAAVAYIYECRLAEDCVIADTKRSRMPPRAFEQFVRLYFPWYRRLAYSAGGWLRKTFARNDTWYRLVDRASARHKKSNGYNDCFNAVIEVCRNIGIDLLVNPSAKVEMNRLSHWDESYGETALLMNCEKAYPSSQYRVICD